MMLIQTPGSFVWSGSLAARLGVAGWSTWGTFLVTGCLQGCLLVMGIYFEILARRAGAETEGESVSSFISLGNNGLANVTQPNAHCVVGYIAGQRANAETDDEGGPVVEDGPSERTPLMNGSRKSSRASGLGRN